MELTGRNRYISPTNRWTKKEAHEILAKKLQGYRAKSYVELKRLLTEQDTFEVTAPSGNSYQLEIQAVWDDRPEGNLRVMGNIDDGGIRAFFPLTYDFIISPDGHFVGE